MDREEWIKRRAQFKKLGETAWDRMSKTAETFLFDPSLDKESYTEGYAQALIDQQRGAEY